MCLNALKALFNPTAPKPDYAAIQAQKSQLALETQRQRELQDKMLRGRRRTTFGGIRTLLSGSGSGFGSNFED